MTGEWVFDGVVWHCSKCGKNPTIGMGYVQSTDMLFRFCPWCGSQNLTSCENVVAEKPAWWSMCVPAGNE